MSTNDTIHQPPAAHSDAERGVFALLALVQNPDAFGERIQAYIAARDEAVQRLEEADARDAALTARSREVEALKTQAEDALAVYRRELDDLARKRDEVERLQNDLFQARAKMEADAAEMRREVTAKAADLKAITDGLEERERLARQVFDQGTALQHDYGAKLAQLKSITAAG